MFVALWEFEVKPGCELSFERAYGPGGDWARLFRTDPHYRETRLLRDPARTRCYVTLDFWDSREAYQVFKKLHQDAYAAIDRACEDLTEREREIGSYSEISGA
jgi:heme-degrading monooxygenase HmoA